MYNSFSNSYSCDDLSIISCEKLYPFAWEEKAHDVEFVYNRCLNRLLESHGKMTEEEEIALSSIMVKADMCRGYVPNSPVLWLPFEKWVVCKEISDIAREWRMGTCIANDREDLLQYC